MEKEAEKLVDEIHVTCEIQCSKCKKLSTIHDLDEWLAADDFFKKGWRKKSTRVYCPECLDKKKK
jgi:hypothetical protein